jgi:sterol desaturase/sphingolipid hydroxylase (fatty acid hydroxylase superfamily)
VPAKRQTLENALSALLDHSHLQAFTNSLIRLFVWLVLLAIVFLPLEQLFAARPRKLLSRNLAGDIGFYFISGFVPGLLLTPVLVLAALGAHAVVPSGVYAAVAKMPIWGRALAALVVGEIGFYWGHRWAHEIPLLWRFHSIHHNPAQVYFLISARAHPLDNVFIRLCGLIPVSMLGIATPLTPAGGVVAALLVVVLTLWGFLIHANIRWRFGPLEWVIATPAFHHWHHTLTGPCDRNFASMLPILDRLFGTHYLPRKQWPQAYGIAVPLPQSMTAQLIHPFRLQHRRAALPEVAADR